MTEVHNPMRIRNRMKRACRPRIIHATRQKPRRTAHAVLLLALAAPDWAAAQDAIDFAPDYIGNFAGVGEAGRSPITDDRGSRNQFIFGVETAYFW